VVQNVKTVRQKDAAYRDSHPMREVNLTSNSEFAVPVLRPASNPDPAWTEFRGVSWNATILRHFVPEPFNDLPFLTHP
jgi:hypothetical protein